MNPEKLATPLPLNEEDVQKKRKSILESSFGGEQSGSASLERGLGEEVREEDVPKESHEDAAARREELRQQIFRGENVGVPPESSTEEVPSGSSNIGKNGRAILKNPPESSS